MSELILKNIHWRETLPLRQSVLRPGQPPEQCHFPGDEDKGTFHIGMIDPANGLVVGIGSFRRDALPSEPPLLGADDARGRPLPYRLRGMAVHPDYRRRGIGDQILRDGERQLRELGSGLLWFNARQDAFRFYQTNGYDFASELFSINGVGPHKVMLKRL
ncbi:MAG: GNAT family N-acetyltransferase [Bdellovibrionaceae bacterium]|nr:GNAT family N-acetyltransferase [Pseudobdellovibrionaceae bacterium]